MKTLLKSLWIVCLSFGLMFAVQSCGEDDPCEDVVCNNNGTCLDGTCDCPQGYEGTNCDDESRTKFLGNYNVTDICSISDTTVYTSTISTSTASTATIILGNFADGFFNGSVTATVDDATVGGTSNLITIALQDVDNDGFTVQGTGTWTTGGTINLSYTLTDPNGATDICTSTLTPQ